MDHDAICTISPGRTGQWTTFNARTGDKTRFVDPGKSLTLVDYKGCGMVTRFWLTLPGWFYRYWDPEATVDPSVLRLTILKIYFDGATEPSVLAPVGDFFGMGHMEYRHFTSKYLGMSSGGFYCYFPMPFATGFRLEIENLHASEQAEIFININYRMLSALPDDAGRFHCAFACGDLQGGDPIRIADIRGRGHFAGCALSIQGKVANALSFLEAPEFIYVDDDAEPSIAGTGLEDYFNGGWYFRNGEFCCETHGVPLKDPLRAMVSMYRFHDADRIGFEKRFSMTFVNPWKKERLRPFAYSSTAYYYINEVGPACYTLPDASALTGPFHPRDYDFQSIP